MYICIYIYIYIYTQIYSETDRQIGDIPGKFQKEGVAMRT